MGLRSRRIRVGIDIHRPKLVDLEKLFVLADAELSEQNRAGRREPYRGSDDQGYR